MCDFGKPHAHGQDFGFLVDTPEIRALVDETRRLTGEITDTAARVEALRPAFSKLLSADGWLPKEYSEPDLKSGMGSGIGQYALYRAEDGSLCLFSLVIPAGAETSIAGCRTKPSLAAWTARRHPLRQDGIEDALSLHSLVGERHGVRDTASV